jgi:hypothetical protein
MINIRKDLIENELENDINNGYFYGRDFNELDYWFIFKKRDRRVK